MRLIVFGATGSTGLEIIRRGLAEGHQVAAFVRKPSKIVIEHDSLTLTVGDVLDPSAVRRAIEGQQIVICSLGTRDLGKNTVRSTGTANIIQAMQEEQVGRLIVISAMGIGDSWSALSMINRFFFATLLGNTRREHELQEKLVKESGLDWTIIRPSGLTGSPGTGDYLVGEHIRARTSRIPRADVADLVIKVIDNQQFFDKAVTITN